MDQTKVSEAYLLGIKEGRDNLRWLKSQGEEVDYDRMIELLENIKAVLRMGFPDEMADFLRGERDFWKNQIKKASHS